MSFLKGMIIMSYYINPNVENLDRIFDQNLRSGYLRLDLNENPGGLPEAFIQKTLSKITPETIAKYPETLPFTETLAKFLHCSIENICLVNGSSEGIRQVIEAFSRPGGRIVGADPSYAMFSVYSKMYGRTFVPVPYEKDLSFDSSKLIDAITPDTDLVILLNPNNPMGNVYTRDEVDAVLKKAALCETTVLIDEAYIYFYPNELLSCAFERDNVFVTRTFSKLFSLGGLRLGYVCGRPEGIRLVQKLSTPHNVNAIGLLFAEEIIKTPGMIDGLIEKQREGKKWLVTELKKNGYSINAGEGNFIFIKPKTDAAAVMNRMKAEKQILIKTYPSVGELGTCLRVTTGERQYMERFLEALYLLDREG